MQPTDTRARGFQAEYGGGATELDALEALQPGALARLLEAALRPYRDASLHRRLVLADHNARAALDSAWGDAMSAHTDQLDSVRQDIAAIARRYTRELERLSGRLTEELAPHRARLERLRESVLSTADGLELDLPSRPQPDTAIPGESAWLFDSSRAYVDQLAVYKRRGAQLDDA